MTWRYRLAYSHRSLYISVLAKLLAAELRSFVASMLEFLSKDALPLSLGFHLLFVDVPSRQDIWEMAVYEIVCALPGLSMDVAKVRSCFCSSFKELPCVCRMASKFKLLANEVTEVWRACFLRCFSKTPEFVEESRSRLSVVQVPLPGQMPKYLDLLNSDGAMRLGFSFLAELPGVGSPVDFLSGNCAALLGDPCQVLSMICSKLIALA